MVDPKSTKPNKVIISQYAEPPITAAVTTEKTMPN